MRLLSPLQKMVGLLVLLGLVTSLVGPASAQPALSSLLISDDFDGSSLDDSLWNATAHSTGGSQVSGAG